MNWDIADKYPVVETFALELFKANPGYQDFFPFKGIDIDKLSEDAEFREGLEVIISYIDQAVAGKADAKRLANKHIHVNVQAAHMADAKTALAKACVAHGVQDLGCVVDEIIKHM